MISFLAALQFLTIFPLKLKQNGENKMAGSAAYFPLIGLLLALALISIDKLFSLLLIPQITVNTILVVLLIIFTGGLHLDGLADTADAIFSQKSREEMLEIMRDSRIGTMGVLSLVSIIFLKISLLSALGASLKTNSLILMLVLSRWSLVVAMFLLPYARGDGKARIFIEHLTKRNFITATAIALVCVFMAARLRGLFIMVLISGLAFGLGNFINNKIRGITGDTLGFQNEIIEVAVLFCVLFMERFIL